MDRFGLVRGLVCLLLQPASLAAQQLPSGTILGQVVDADQNPLERVEVRLINLSTAKSIVAHTDLAGDFSFSGLSSDRYSLAVHREGYTLRRVGPYEVLPDLPVEVHVALERLAPPLTRPKAGLEGMALEYGLVREQIESVPLLIGSEGRTAADKLLLLVPGMSPVKSLEVDPLSGQAAAASANGSPRSAINYQLDGASNNAQNRITGAQAATFGPTPEAIDTFRVVTHTYSARDGRNAGAVVSAVTRSGGADWHGQARAFWRPRGDDVFEAFDGSTDSIRGAVGGGNFGGPLSLKHGLFLFADGEIWGTNARHGRISPVLTAAERAGDFSDLPDQRRPLDPTARTPFPNGIVPPSAFDPLMEKYLDTFLPRPNVDEDLHLSESDLDSSGEMWLGRLDFRRDNWGLHLSYFNFRGKVHNPLRELNLAPGTTTRVRQFSHNPQLTLAHTPTPGLEHSFRVAAQRLSTNFRQGHADFLDTPAEDFGFDFLSFGANPGTIPDLTLFDDDGSERLRIAPFLTAESSAQTTFQVAEDAVYRRGMWLFRGGALFRRGIWPFTNVENSAGSFEFSRPGFFGTLNGAANMLVGVPSTYRLRTPRSLNLRWNEFAFYGETELRPVRGLQVTLGLRFESQPPAVDRLDRIAAFREDVESQRFADTLPNLIFPGDPDGDFGPLPRSTIRTDGRHLSPRLGVTFSPTWENRWWRWMLGESGRSVFRASYGVFNDFGTFAGSSAAALLQATYPPYSTDNRYDFARIGQERGSFSAPLSTVPGAEPDSLQSSLISYPILVFDPNFENARAEHWTIGWQRLLPQRIFFSAIYLGTRTSNLQRQQEVNTFFRNPAFGFSFIRNMRRFPRYSEVRSFESSGSGRYNGVQLRATRYLTSDLAFEAAYTWSEAFDDGSDSLRNTLVTEPWSFSDFDRTHTVAASWFYRLRLPRKMRGKLSWADDWRISGAWRWRSGLPLDIRQTQDPTFSFLRVGRPDQVGDFRRLDPGAVRSFTLADGHTATGRFAFDPTAFEPVVPTNFDELREGSAPRNGFRMHGFQQWDLRLSKVVAVGETASIDAGFDMLNVFDNKNWDAPFSNIDHPYFGIVRAGGLDRTFQLAVRFRF